jgi:hypothetical protein
MEKAVRLESAKIPLNLAMNHLPATASRIASNFYEFVVSK